MKDIFRVAIDGPGGAGKSTVAKEVANALGIDYIDTGAMYRAVGYKIIREGIDPDDEETVEKMLSKTDIDFVKGDVMLDGEKVNGRIRTPEVSEMASLCSAYSFVRKKLVAAQRKMGETKSIIMDGRDIGTNVLADAEYKFFVTASPDERAKRRQKELSEKGEDISYEEVLKDIIKRDHKDTTRKLNPLKQAEDAILIDTTGMTVEEVVSKILKEIK
ncbi:MAG TPA: (d)CMP kinase [Bacillota bacterium]|nr:(d)CMP kinase [Bacillota bacterium]HUM56805.1 (d)CMP kinase [Bacillota bacterium]